MKYKSFKVVLFTGTAKYTFCGRFKTLIDAHDYYAAKGGRVIEIKELRVQYEKRA